MINLISYGIVCSNASISENYQMPLKFKMQYFIEIEGFLGIQNMADNIEHR